LVPGVSIEDQKVKYGVDKTILSVVGGLVIAFVVWGVLAPEQVFNTSSTALDWVMRNLGWIFTALATFLMFLLLILAFSKYGKIPLGVDGEKPEFSQKSRSSAASTESWTKTGTSSKVTCVRLPSGGTKRANWVSLSEA